MSKGSVSCIYIILNKKNNKVYIGQSQNVRKRWNEHKRSLSNGNHHNRYLQRSWDKYGAKAFKFQILEYCPIEHLDEREQHYLDIYIGKGVSYNICTDAMTTRGVRPTEETRAKISRGTLGIKKSPETRARMSAARKGLSCGKGLVKSPEHREKIGAVQRKPFIVTTPEGIEFEIVGLAKFCRENGLDLSTMSGVANGYFKQHKGWKCRKVEC